MHEASTAESGGDGSEEFFAGERAYQLWILLFGVLIVSLWVQWVGLGALTEIESEDGSATILALHLLPLGIGALAMVWEHPSARLFLFPASFLPGFLMLPDLERQALMEPRTLTMAVATLGVYFVVAASRPAVTTLFTTGLRQLQPQLLDPLARRFRRLLVIRVILLAAIGVVITYGLFFDAHIAGHLAQLGEQEEGDVQFVFMVVLLYFSWMIVIYMAGILPLLNWEYERRQTAVSKSLRRLLRHPDRLRRRIILWIGLLFLTVTAILWNFDVLS